MAARSIIYQGSFVSRENHRVDVKILRLMSGVPSSVGELSFVGDEPLTIEWESRDKEEVLCGSSATLVLISPGDRTYKDLYTIAPGEVTLEVYRDGAIYWRGALDPEFYEEPYTTTEGYEVSLTFSDFGLLSRLKYNLSGVQTIGAIVVSALSSAQLYSHYELMSSTSFEDGSAVTLESISVRSDNFCDEEGKWNSLEKVLTGVLQPLGLRIIQRSGEIYIYDLNALYEASAKSKIVWQSNDAVMGVDKVANGVKITFSPYSQSKLMNEESFGYKGTAKVDVFNRSNTPLSVGNDGTYCHSWYPDYEDSEGRADRPDYDDIDFTLFYNYTKHKGLASIGSGCAAFKILPVTGSVSETEGVIWGYYTGGHGPLSKGWSSRIGNSVLKPEGFQKVMTTNRLYVPKLSQDYWIRVTEEMLIDVRYNPFSGSKDYNDKKEDELIEHYSDYVFIPVKIQLYDAEGNVLYHYSNKAVAEGVAEYGILSSTKGSWEEGAAHFGDCWFEYYDKEKPNDGCKVRGWNKNRQAIGRADGLKGHRKTPKMFDSFKKMGDGQYLPAPPCGGYLEISIGGGVIGHDGGKTAVGDFYGNGAWVQKGIYPKIRWALYKAPVVEVVKNTPALSETSMDDVEYSGILNEAAKEDISIDTICGTADDATPMARGAYLKTSDGSLVSKLMRAGVTDGPERLLIGTLYSQYASRHTTLSGTVDICDGPMRKYTENSQKTGTVFILKSDLQDLAMDLSEAAFVELSGDNYQAEEV